MGSRALIPIICLAIWPSSGWGFTDSLEACGVNPRSLQIEGLESLGWERVSVFDGLDARQSENLAWTLMVPYLSRVDSEVSDRGGQSVQALFELQQKAVPGLFAKVATETTESHVLVRDSDVLTTTHLRQDDGTTKRSCRLALDTGVQVVSGSSFDTEGHAISPRKGIYASETIHPQETIE